MSRLNKILVAYDGSPHSKEALNWAIDLSLLSGAQVLYRCVMRKSCIIMKGLIKFNDCFLLTAFYIDFHGITAGSMRFYLDKRTIPIL